MVKPLIVLCAVFGVACGTRHLGRIAPDAPVESAHSGGLVKPLKFNQPLLLCNAYPSKSTMQIAKNGQNVLPALHFQECKYSEGNVLAKDKLDFVMGDAGIEGTFEVGDLPQTDSVLLLVVQKRDERSPLMAFQSFAFPTNSGGQEAHVAVIDAVPGMSKAHLQIADRPKQGDVKRAEELSFNRVYALEQGAYDVSVLDQGKETPKEEVQLFGKKDYVLLRTGGQELGVRSLVAFPKDEAKSGAERPAALAALVAAVAAMMALA